MFPSFIKPSENLIWLIGIVVTIYSDMDKHLLRPRELCIEPGALDAGRIFAFYLRTVEDFNDSLRELRRDGDPEVKKKRIIINCLTPRVYPCVKEAADYADVVRILKSLYVKQKNDVYARHLLVSRRQLQGEIMCEYLQVLKTLAKDCTSSDVTAATYREEVTRDAFINGLSSAYIRLRLLEKVEITLVQAFELAQSLDRAQRQGLFEGQPSTQPLSSAAFVRQRVFHGKRPTVSSNCQSDSDQTRSPPSTCPSTVVAQRRVSKKTMKTSGKRCFFVMDNFTRDTLALLVMQPVSFWQTRAFRTCVSIENVIRV